MDKLSSSKTITIKINGENRSFQEEIANQDTSKNTNHEREQILVNSWTDSPQKKHESYKEAAASQELVEESFDWILPEPSENEINEYKFVKPAQSKKNTKRKWTKSSITSAKKKAGIFKSVFFSILFAVLIGISFGIMMLKLVTEDHSKEAAIEATVPVNEAKSPVGSSSPIDVTLKAYTAFVVQGGVYSTKAAANGISNLAISKGATSEIIEIDGKNFLILGLADSINSAKNLGNYYKQNGISDIWAKSFPVPEKTFTAVNQDEKNFLDMAPSLFQMLTEVTSNAIVNQTIPNESLNSITKSDSDLISMGSEKFKNTKIKNLKSELMSVMGLVKDYQKSNNKKEIVKAQQHLLKYFSLYYSF